MASRGGADGSALRIGDHAPGACVNDITRLILTFNEAPNIARTLGQLSWLRDIVIVDSMSTDGTARDRGALSERPRRSSARSRRMRSSGTSASSRPASRPNGCWRSMPTIVLTDDAESRAPGAATRRRPCRVFAASFDYCIDGQPLRGAAYPPVTVLYRRARGRYEQDGHTQRVRRRRRGAAACRAHPARRSQVAQLTGSASQVALHGARGRQARWTRRSASLGLADRAAPMDRDRAAGDVCLLLFLARRDSRRQGRAVLRAAARGVGTDPVVVLVERRCSAGRYAELASRPNRARRAG